jgi:MoxR-like ATPase
MELFDSDLRDTERWQDWESKGNYKFAISHYGALYPVKQIVAQATGASTDGFSGGEEANGWLQRRGFSVVQLRDTSKPVSAPPAWWWVNQSATYEHERDGGYLWAPKLNKAGRPFSHWTNMTELKVGDAVVHYGNSAIRAVGIVTVPTTDRPRPSELPSDSWEEDGYYAEVLYYPLEKPIALRDIPVEWRRPGTDTPFTIDGSVKQGYLFPVPSTFVAPFLTQFRSQLPAPIQALPIPHIPIDTTAVDAIRAIVETMYPDEGDRFACLTLMADAIEHAHLISPASWATSYPTPSAPGENDLCFNVLWTQPCVMRQGKLLLVIDRDELDDAAHSMVDTTLIDPLNGPTYDSLPELNPYRVYVPAEQFDVLPQLRQAYLGFVETCAKRVKSRVHRYQEHLPAIVTYISQELGRELPQPDYGTVPDMPDQTWLFQATPSVWNLAERLQNRVDGDDDTWSVTRFRYEMGPGQPLVMWQAGSDAGIYAVGELLDEPGLRKASDFWPNLEGRAETEWAVPFRYTRILDQPILRRDLLQHPVLKDLDVIRAPQGTNYKLSAEQWEALQALLDGELPSPPTIDDLAVITNLDRADLEELEDLLRDKQQLVLEGPPGSGKTYLAEHFARYFAGLPLNGEPDERVETVQFHQSYGYEDFVQGIRPVTTESGQLQYHVVAGIFLRMCDLASRNPDQDFVLIIDEINRGNLSRIFGELLLLLEYREKRVRLPYGAVEGQVGHTYLTIPRNLYLIGTMNSTDRSLALIDYALRRRFYFYRLLPVVAGEAPVLARWLASKGFAAEDQQRILQLFVALNAAIEEHLSSDFQVGHSYFMRSDIHTDAGLNRVWQRAIRPLLEEYLHGVRNRETVLAEFELDVLLKAAPGESEPNTFDPDTL